MISHKHNFIFIHIPKTGGTSVNHSLNKYCEVPPEILPGVRNPMALDMYKKHVKLVDICKHMDITSFFKFCVIRNPWDRILSLYFWKTQHGKRVIDTQELNFNSWIKNVFLNDISHKFWANQCDYISINNVLCMDYVIKFEDFTNDWNIVCNKLQISAPLSHEYKTNHAPYNKYYNDESINAIHKMFKRDIDTFKYTFN